MTSYRAGLLGLLLSSVLSVSSGDAQPAPARKGYWKFTERVWVEAPAQNRHRWYPVVLTPNGDQVTALCRVLDPNRKVQLVVEELHTWKWTSPPGILIPGERFPMRIEVEVKQLINRTGTKYDFGGNFDAGFGVPKPTGNDQYRYGGDTQLPGGRGRGNLQIGGEFGVHGPGTFVKESFIVVPPKTAWQVPKHPGRLSFRVGGNYSFGWNTRYEYVWVDGDPPADRGTTSATGNPAGAPTAPAPGGVKDTAGAPVGAPGGDTKAAPTGGGASGRPASVLRLIMTRWAGSQTNYAKGDQDLLFEVGMGSNPRWGYGYAGVELQNVRQLSVEVLGAPATYAHYDANSFAGFVIHYATPVGNGKRVMLGTGMLDRKRGDIMFLDGAGVYAPPATEFADLGVQSSYELDLGRWAPPDWTGKVVVVIGLQNAGENAVLKARFRAR